MVYYISSYAELVKDGEVTNGEKINIVVPTGNFGNILAAYYAKNMGVPIDRLICASNKNNVLTDFFASGTYDRRRDFYLTMSPSMDILISSNLERLINLILDGDDKKTAEEMKKLVEEGSYSIPKEILDQKIADFYGGFASEEETAAEIKAVYEDCGYVIDTHTAVASAVYKKYVDKTGDKTPTVIASTASPYKFTRSVMQAIGQDRRELSDLELTDVLSDVANTEIPAAIVEIRDAEVRHKTICEVDEMPKVVREFLNI